MTASQHLRAQYHESGQSHVPAAATAVTTSDKVGRKTDAKSQRQRNARLATILKWDDTNGRSQSGEQDWQVASGTQG